MNRPLSGTPRIEPHAAPLRADAGRQRAARPEFASRGEPGSPVTRWV
ncbi:hypothetical protein WQQ_37580 [Hydrocarboniphaga effusa AP103]|uniref:Uncharacterized protein n=1 Tax=Hydrocarboniphaga effusa AP103 TaxID=1172194 RepID=I8T4D0_9GAMM|nr:hypothetical protein WQQ_37580 [Hydrocarboniphaga effusa AP103]